MWLKSLYLHNFRVYKEAFFEFSPSFNVILGLNAQGKTSLLEAMYFLATGKSFRGAQIAELILQGQSHFYLEACFVKHGMEHTLKATCGLVEKKFVFNYTPFPSSAQLLGLLQGVVIAPDDATIVKGAPAIRRQYLDLQIAQIDPLYVHHLTRYSRALRQRNCLLKAKQALTVESWEHEMALSAAYLTKQRWKLVADLRNLLQDLHARLTGEKENLSLFYKGAEDLPDLSVYFLESYRKSRKREMELGFTLIGPHKDDLLVMINECDARTFGSEGQQRTCVATLRCAEWERLNGLLDESPIMFVDDVGISLDDHRKKLLLGHLNGMSQVFLTTTQEDVVDLLGEGTRSIDLRRR